MKIVWTDIKIKGKKVKALLIKKELGDKEILRNLYFDWKNINDRLKEISTRGINLPEAISENAFALFFNDCVRVVKINGMKCSFDILNLKTDSKIQIKATSVKSDLTSFGPRSEWDELFFLDFSTGDGTFKVYKIEADWIYKHKVNKNQTFEEMQNQGKRPRFSIIKNIIKLKQLKPIKIFKL